MKNTIRLLFVFLWLCPLGVFASDDGIKVQGTIDAITADSITVSAVSYVITSDTEFEDANDTEVSWTEFSVGDFVEVEYLTSGDSLIALEVELEDESDLEVKGVIESISETLIVINSKAYALNDSTSYQDEEDNSVARTFFSAGMVVEVEYTVIDSTRVALKVEEESASEDDDSSVDNEDQDDNDGPRKVFERASLSVFDSSVDSSLKGKVIWRFRDRPLKNRTRRRLKGTLLVPVPSSLPIISDRDVARNAQFFLTLYRNNLAYAQCYFEFDEFEQKITGEFAEYKVDIRLRTRENRDPRFRAQKGSCDTDLAANGVQSGMPDVASGDTVIVGDSEGDYLTGTL